MTDKTSYNPSLDEIDDMLAKLKSLRLSKSSPIDIPSPSNSSSPRYVRDPTKKLSPEELASRARERQRKYYAKNREKILAKGRDRRKLTKAQKENDSIATFKLIL